MSLHIFSVCDNLIAAVTALASCSIRSNCSARLMSCDILPAALQSLASVVVTKYGRPQFVRTTINITGQGQNSFWEYFTWDSRDDREAMNKMIYSQPRISFRDAACCESSASQQSPCDPWCTTITRVLQFWHWCTQTQWDTISQQLRCIRRYVLSL